MPQLPMAHPSVSLGGIPSLSLVGRPLLRGSCLRALPSGAVSCAGGEERCQGAAHSYFLEWQPGVSLCPGGEGAPLLFSQNLGTTGRPGAGAGRGFGAEPSAVPHASLTLTCLEQGPQPACACACRGRVAGGCVSSYPWARAGCAASSAIVAVLRVLGQRRVLGRSLLSTQGSPEVCWR